MGDCSVVSGLVKGGMERLWLVVLAAWLIAAPIGFMLWANIFRLGLIEGFEIYGPVFTLISALGFFPVLLGVASLFDRAQRGNQEDQKKP